ncbi:AmmeMemoRadiSam system radical SAM enzyme [candidate division KSB1 bacterium]|nr:MAG: AmmeMemoRadiSam system radical SAM enzyme [candidate division KSB1 bacterium]
MDVSRREFFKTAGKFGLVFGEACAALSSPAWLQALGNASADLYAASKIEELARTAPRARYWISTDSDGNRCAVCHMGGLSSSPGHQHAETFVKCLLCAQGCVLRNRERGKCSARMNVNGEMRSLVYGRPMTIHTDPIEKKPFYHFLPGSAAFSLATSGCPLHCRFCQNWQISQAKPEDYDVQDVPPSEIVNAAANQKAPIIAFTYNEPTVFCEYLLDIAVAARAQNMRSVLVSCGFMNEEPLADMCAVLDAIKIDLKGYSDDFYRKVCSAELNPVLRSIQQVARSGTHLEIVNLVVPTLNDSDSMLNGLCDWLAGEVGPDVPVHFTRFHPDFQLLNLSPTPIETLERARELAISKGIRYAYVGNVPGHEGNHTYCPGCGRIVIHRNGFFVSEFHIQNGACEYCGQTIAGVWS